MKKLLFGKLYAQKRSEESAKRKEINERLFRCSLCSEKEIYGLLNSDKNGITEEQADEARAIYGDNVITHGKKDSLIKRIISSFVNPFTAILFLLAAVSVVTDIVLAVPGEKNATTVIIITAMVLISGILRFVQETKSGNAAAKLTSMIKTTATVKRADSEKAEIPIDELLVGDIVFLSAGDMIPADIRILSAKDLFISQASLTGESEPVEKLSVCAKASDNITESENIAFMGTAVISGSAKGIVAATGNDTMLGEMAKVFSVKPPKTSFEKGVNSVSFVLIRFMLIMVPIVLFLNGFTKGDWIDAALFAISIAVGLTPEMLPMIVTTCLAKGAVTMSGKKVIIKNLNSIQNLGSMDILCTDKTGTLTRDKVVLEYHLDVHGNEDSRVLRHAFLNSNFQTGLKNLIDIAIITRAHEISESGRKISDIEENYTKVDEIPFDFERRRMSVVVADKCGKTQLITKGAAEEMFKVSSFAEYDKKVIPLTDEVKETVMEKVRELNRMGMRVIAVSQKSNPSPVGAFSVSDEKDMVLIGYLAFLDPPKETAASAIKALNKNGVSVKVLTGDNENVTACICKKVGLQTQNILLGSDVEQMSDEELISAAIKTNVFAKLSPSQKARVVTALKLGGHTVGYMGDGINDAAAMRVSDVGISVDSAVDIAKESADVILLQKDLMVLEDGIIEGRKTYANMIKYIKMTSSSNFGNMLSVLVAGAFLPFLPMESIHLILLNLIYDISCIAIPWDNVDSEFLAKPTKWEASSISKFMLWMGPVSSVFDIATYLLLYFVICPAACGGIYYNQLANPAVKALFVSVFQTGWFIESMWTQTLVIHMIRTQKLPFVKSRASAPVLILNGMGIAVLTAIPFTFIGRAIGLAAMPGEYFLWLLLIIIGYCLLATAMKKIYIKRYKKLL